MATIFSVSSSSASSSCSYLVRCCSSMRDQNHEYNKQNLNSSIKINGSSSSSSRSQIKVDSLSQTAEASVLYIENGQRQNIPTKKQLVDPYRQGLIVEGGVGYRQTVVVRSYEVGPDKTATLESILSLLQVV